MNNRKAKAIRKFVYGDTDYRERKYKKHNVTGQVIADEKRQKYQKAKKLEMLLSKG